jgi:hypothetical protein
MSWIGAVVGAASSAAQGYGNYRFNYLSQYHNWLWQKEAMQNRHQWEVDDLRKAGLNPILSANQGASTGGLNAGGSAVQMPDVASSAFQGLQMQNLLNKQKAEIDNIKKDTELKEDQRFAQEAIANANRLQAVINSENAYSLYRENRFWDDNPLTFRIKKANDAFPGVGGLAGILSGITENASSASELKRLRDLADRFFESGGNGKR